MRCLCRRLAAPAAIAVFAIAVASAATLGVQPYLQDLREDRVTILWTAHVQVSAGGAQCETNFAELAPAPVCVNQVNFRAPSGLTGATAVQVTANGAASNTVPLSLIRGRDDLLRLFWRIATWKNADAGWRHEPARLISSARSKLMVPR
jgi:hypothetical protein